MNLSDPNSFWQSDGLLKIELVLGAAGTCYAIAMGDIVLTVIALAIVGLGMRTLSARAAIVAKYGGTWPEAREKLVQHIDQLGREIDEEKARALLCDHCGANPCGCGARHAKR